MNMKMEDRDISVYTLGQLMNTVKQSENGLVELPHSNLSVVDERYYDTLEQGEGRLVILTMQEGENDYFRILENGEVQHTDDWSGLDMRTYSGATMDHLYFIIEENYFLVQPNSLRVQMEEQQIDQELDFEEENEMEI